jgi:hypothetical protein
MFFDSISFAIKFSELCDILQWLYNKMCALPLPEVLGDFEDAINVSTRTFPIVETQNFLS